MVDDGFRYVRIAGSHTRISMSTIHIVQLCRVGLIRHDVMANEWVIEAPIEEKLDVIGVAPDYYDYDIDHDMHVQVLRDALSHITKLDNTNLKEEKTMLYEGYVIADYNTKDERIIKTSTPVLTDDETTARNAFVLEAAEDIQKHNLEPNEITVLVRPFK